MFVKLLPQQGYFFMSVEGEVQMINRIYDKVAMNPGGFSPFQVEVVMDLCIQSHG